MRLAAAAVVVVVLMVVIGGLFDRDLIRVSVRVRFADVLAAVGGGVGWCWCCLLLLLMLLFCFGGRERCMMFCWRYRRDGCCATTLAWHESAATFSRWVE